MKEIVLVLEMLNELRKETGEFPEEMPKDLVTEEPAMEEPKVEAEQPAPQGLMARR